MKTKLFRTIFALILLTTFQGTLHGQGSNIDIRFLKAKFTDTISGKDLVAVFLVSTRDTSNFPPEIRLPPKCTVFEDGREKVVLLNPHALSVSLDDAKIPEKHPEIYELIKDLIDLKSMQNKMIISYFIKDLNYNFKKMSLTPAFNEKRNKTIRVDKRCEFEVH